MINNALNRLDHLLNTIPPLLISIDEAEFSFKPAEDKWSKKEILGHLIDSAANNHQRFVRAQFEKNANIVYRQNEWVTNSHHQQFDGSAIISFWEHYNQHLLQLLRLLPTGVLSNTLFTGVDTPVTLEFVITDYITHMEHHLRQIVTY